MREGREARRVQARPGDARRAHRPGHLPRPDLEFEEPFARFQLAQVTEGARRLIDVTEAERAARARPVMKQKGMMGGRNTALGMLASNLADKGKLGEAMRIADSIEEPHDRLWAYQMMALAIRNGGDD